MLLWIGDITFVLWYHVILCFVDSGQYTSTLFSYCYLTLLDPGMCRPGGLPPH